MDTSNKEKTFKPYTSDEQVEQTASFKETYDSIAVLFESKIAKLKASKNLVVAEAKISLSAILLSFAISLTLVVIVAVIWVLINFGLGLLVVELTQSLSLSLFILLTINILLGLWLFKQLKSIWKLVGFHSMISTLVEDD